MTRRIIPLGLFVIAAAITLASFSVLVREEVTWIDTVTGSTQQQAIWCIGSRSAEHVEPSPIARWVIDHEGSIDYRWKVTSDTSVTLWGRPVMFACDTAPPIYGFPTNLMPHFIASSTDDEIRNFIKTMQSGTRANQSAAVIAAIDQALNAMLKSP